MPLLPVSRHTRHFGGRAGPQEGRESSAQLPHPEQLGWRSEDGLARPRAWACAGLAEVPSRP